MTKIRSAFPTIFEGSPAADQKRSFMTRIAAYEDLLNGNGGLFDGVVDIIPGMRQDIEGKLHEAQELKRRVCDPVLNPE